ncbi:metallophosphoesterase family protein [Chloroflexota bacterium]
MIIGVISDTHVTTIDDIPAITLKVLAEADLIVHAGDFTERAVLDGLKSIGEIKAVSGNMDSVEIKRMLPKKESFVINGKNISLIHGWGGPSGIADRIRDMFTDADIIIYGHSHEPWNQFIRGSLLFNPGRARDSFGLLRIDDKIKAEMVTV